MTIEFCTAPHTYLDIGHTVCAVCVGMAVSVVGVYCNFRTETFVPVVYC